jgi:sec-independent protein translocase protein TatB
MGVGRTCPARFGKPCRARRGHAGPLKVVKTVSRMHCRYSFPSSMMKRMSFSETIFLFFLALIIFGPKKLPEIARQVGKVLNEFRRASNEFKSQIEQEIANLEVENKKQTILPPSAAPEGTASRALNAAPTEASVAQSDVAESTSAEAKPPAATLAASGEEPVASTGQPATEALPASDLTASDAVTSPSTQESHA